MALLLRSGAWIEDPALHSYDTSSVKSTGGGGSVWSPEMQRACREALPGVELNVSVGYGLTETSGLATSASHDVLLETPDSVGYPLPTVEVKILDDDGTELPDDEIGNVSMRGPVVTPGYWNDPDATASTISAEGWLRSGDFGSMRDGKLFLASRRTDLIIRGDENIYPSEIENRLDAHPAVMEVCVVGRGPPPAGPGGEGRSRGAQGHEPDRRGAVGLGGRNSCRPQSSDPLGVPHRTATRNATGKVLKNVVMGNAENTFVED